MNIIHAVNTSALPRHVQRALAERLRVMPAVVVTGARQTGKSTLVQVLTPGDRRFFSLDDLDVADLARRDPEALVGDSAPVTLDEVQREPDLLLAVKRAIDRRRRAGQFLLTGSANLLLMRRVSESLAGRASYLTLWPMTRREQRGMGRCGLWEELLVTEESGWLDLLRAQDPAPEDWQALARRGGFPVPAVHMTTAAERGVWFEGYVRTYLERDLQVLSAISALPDFRRLMRAACLRLGQLVNQTELARDVALPQPTVHRYLNLLEISFLLVRVPAYAASRTKRLVKTPKLYWGDVGLALHLSGLPEPTGAHLENLVLHDLLCWRDARTERAEIFYWRTAAGQEVDFVVESNGRLLPIEVKATTRPRLADVAALRAFRAESGDACRAGLLLHTGTKLEWLTTDVLAAPWWMVC
ncbi:ATP-binding protein [Candidatus Bipolaricaulota bacterium]|nr:ATP-binding protein [Candidatus Bipolaricaulota bacterium]